VAGTPQFADRVDAGRRLVAILEDLGPEPVVLGLARGGVPVAAQVARGLGARLDVLVVRKVGHPAQPEYALGAVSEDGVVLPDDLPAPAAAAELDRARAQARALRGARGPLEVRGRTAVVIDDGLATGHTMEVALETVRRRGAARVVMAVPVAAGPGFRRLAGSWEARALAVVEPPEFFAVGQFYDDFGQVEDARVAELLEGGG